MTRASTTPSILLTSFLIAVAILWATFWFLPVTRMLIGVDLPFVHGRTDHAAGIEGELQVAELRISCRTAVRSIWTYSWAECFRSPWSWILTTASIGPAFGV